MKELSKPNFKNLKYGAGGGLPIIKSIWERFSFSYLFLSIDKHSGLSPWKMVFAYIAGIIANSSSVNKIASHCSGVPVLKEVLGGIVPSQSALSRFFSKQFNWLGCSVNRIKLFCSAPETIISEGDVVALDDTKIEHPYGKKLPFLCWLFDNSEKRHIWCMNLVSTLLVRANGLTTPLFWRIWVQDKDKASKAKLTKLELAKDMLLSLRSITPVRLWVAMDRWFLCKDFFQWLNSNGFDWVTKCKRNTALYQLSGYDWNNNPRYSPVNPRQLLEKVYPILIKTGKPGECVSISIPDIYIKLPVMKPNKKGRLVKKQVYTPAASVAVIRLPEDMNTEQPVIDLANPDEKAAHFKGSYLLISNRYDAPEQAVLTYAKRWKIEVFYRTAKQELGLTSCHAQSKSAHEAHIEMLFITETMLSYANWELNKDGAITLTHGEMVREIINATHRICLKDKLQVYFDIAGARFSRFFKKFWPKYYNLGFGLLPFHILEPTA
ncbi:transposase [Desulfitobacterium hafniense]|uniref:transposase n=1 Tax=Desulfitobacterium TaxID=36853 RepID=UPI001FD8E4B3|nr:transposase [Desulfitobacterium hafniense]